MGRDGGTCRGRGRGGQIQPTETVVTPTLDMFSSQPTIRRSPRHQPNPNVIATSSHPILPTPELLRKEVPASLNFPKPSKNLHKMMPITIQKRRGVFISKKQVTPADNIEKELAPRRRNLSISLSTDVELENMDDEAEGDDYLQDYDSDNGDDTDESVDEENSSEDEYMPMIHDNYDPYDEPMWENTIDGEDTENYMNKLYANGEVYNTMEFGKIILKPWQLFMDKAQLRDAVGDYCIQCGFSIIVDKTNNSRYTVQCGAENCSWRLHASRLPDGVTWAIKTIKNAEHTCFGLVTREHYGECKVGSKGVVRGH
ncbi:uncharacterized protein LOC110710294 [Chenopodium quinoa]|uniref:uncharacterized protein LOC110710294 n=1 Tax=Chenopodium quinoa TaxID=63459 RepID=UPI000B788834|nr:uncharacterized protein LOC110710294 [Chenopodium quinoa]XP_021744263.1 uncharacterized protein LOC110710294 [Chenopodium quinoa]XP_021744264.1 uncharacterized protein LOC110710294 [Chenopodium quinoa]